MYTFIFFLTTFLVHTSCFTAAAAGAGADVAKTNCDTKLQAAVTRAQAQDQKTFNNFLHSLPRDIAAKFLWNSKRDITKSYLSPVRDVLSIESCFWNRQAFSHNYAILASSTNPTVQILQRQNDGTWPCVFSITMPTSRDGEPYKDLIEAVDINENYAICGSRDGIVYIIERKSDGAWKQVNEFKHNHGISSVKLDGTRAISTSFDEVYVRQQQPDGGWKIMYSICKSNYSKVFNADLVGNFVIVHESDAKTPICDHDNVRIINLKNNQTVYTSARKVHHIGIALSEQKALVASSDIRFSSIHNRVRLRTIFIDVIECHNSKWQKTHTFTESGDCWNEVSTRVALAQNYAVMHFEGEGGCSTQVSECVNGQWQAPYTVAKTEQFPTTIVNPDFLAHDQLKTPYSASTPQAVSHFKPSFDEKLFAQRKGAKKDIEFITGPAHFHDKIWHLYQSDYANLAHLFIGDHLKPAKFVAADDKTHPLAGSHAKIGNQVITFNPSLDQLSPDKALKLAQYNFIDDLEIALHLYPQGIIVLTDQQLKLFKTLPVQKRMALKKQHGLATADAIQKIRNDIAHEKMLAGATKCTLM